MDTNGIDSAATAGIAATAGAVLMKLIDAGARLIPAFSGDKKIDKRIDQHKELCRAETKQAIDVINDRLAAGNRRFQSIEDRAEARHKEIIGYLMDIRGARQ